MSGLKEQGGMTVAVVGSGISGLAAAWLLSQRHNVTLFEADDRIGGHSHTVDAGPVPVDTGFIIFNEQTYPNLTALFRHLEVPTKLASMTLGISIGDGRLEYSGTNLRGLFAQWRNLVRPRFWSMLRDLVRFYRDAAGDVADLGDMSLGDYLDSRGYGQAFRDDHLYPMAAAIWSTPAVDMPHYPAAVFIRFWENHGLLKLSDRPPWRTVDGGSRVYVDRLIAGFADRIRTGQPVSSIRRLPDGVEVSTPGGPVERFDHVVIATHADQALRLLADPDPQERTILGAFKYQPNDTILHTDPALMPKRRRVWSSWNYLTGTANGTSTLSVTYWMNPLQSLESERPLFVSLNPIRQPDPALVIRRDLYEHPVFDAGTNLAQGALWSLQGVRNSWFCGAYFGAGFHEDGLQAGLAVAEQLGGVRRPWTVPAESGRIQITGSSPTVPNRVAA